MNKRPSNLERKLKLSSALLILTSLMLLFTLLSVAFAGVSKGKAANISLSTIKSHIGQFDPSYEALFKSEDAARSIIESLTEQNNFGITAYIEKGQNTPGTPKAHLGSVTIASAPSFDLTSPADNASVWHAKPVFAWQPIAGIQKYQLFVDDVLNKDNISSLESSINPASSLDAGAHTWYIKAVDATGDSQNSASTRSVLIDPNAKTWAQVNLNGFGNKNNLATLPSWEFNGYIYGGASNYVQGAEMWRSPDGINWSQVFSGGWGSNPNNTEAMVLPLAGYLYGESDNVVEGAELWRSSDGTSFSQTSSFSDPTIQGALVTTEFNGYIYAGSWDETDAGKIWRSASNDGATWTQVNTSGFGDANTTETLPDEVFNGYLYAGAVNGVSGGSLWRTNNGTSWTEVTVGFNKSNFRAVTAIKSFSNKLYIATQSNSAGSEIWRTSDGVSWESVVTNGFGDASNGIRHGGFLVAGGSLYASTQNWSTGGQIWRTSDGSNWSQVVSDGFGDPWNGVFRKMVLNDGKIYVPAYNFVTGGEIWALPLSQSLSASKSGSGTGSVTSTPAGISCGTTCAASFDNSAVVTLTAVTDSGSTFAGWGGACSGTGLCTVTMDADKAVTATFNLIPPPTTTTTTLPPTTTTTVPSSGSVITPTGRNVNVDPIPTVDITFSSVDSGGTTTVTTGSNGHGEPSDFRLFGQRYTIETTATFSGPITVCFKYDQAALRNENGVKLFHYDNGRWVDITTSVDTTNNIVCGTTSHFSDFMMGGPSLPNTGRDQLPATLFSIMLVLWGSYSLIRSTRKA